MTMEVKLLVTLPIFAILTLLSGPVDAYQYYQLKNYCQGGRGEGHLDLGREPLDYGLVVLTTTRGYDKQMDCWVNITAPAGKGIVMRINYVDIYKPIFERCTTDRLRIFSVIGWERTPVGGYICGTGTPPHSLFFDNGVLALHFVSGNSELTRHRRGFELVFTSWRTPLTRIGNHTVVGSCRNSSAPNKRDGEFECTNRPHGKMCIPDNLRCDRYDNCGDFSDERGDRAKCPGGLSIGVIVGIALGAAGACILLCLCVGCILRRSAHRQKESDRTSAATVAMLQSGSGSQPTPQYTTPTPVQPPPYTPSGSGDPTTTPAAPAAESVPLKS